MRKNGPPIYKSYVFKDKDPVIDQLRTLIEDHLGRRVTRKDLVDISDLGGPTAGCMSSWFFGDTCRPQNPTIEAAGRAIGYERRWVKRRR